MNYLGDSEKGLTLIEVLVSAVVLVIVILGGMQFFIFGSARINREGHRRAALELAQQKIEELLASNYGEVVSGSETGLPLDGIDCNRSTEVTYVDDPADALGTDDDDPQDYKRVSVIVSWNETGRLNTVILETWITP